jgi:hypothetical protein
MLFWGSERRINRRYAVDWEATIIARFPGFTDNINATVINFSIAGGLLHTKTLAVYNNHLVVTGERPELTLKIGTPEGVIESKIDIRWYRWSFKKSVFEVGVAFNKLKANNKPILDLLMPTLRKKQANHKSKVQKAS